MAVKRSLRNEEFLHWHSNPELIKHAQDRLGNFVRLMVREGSVTRNILVPEHVTHSDLDRQYDTDVPTIVVDVEPNAPAAISVGFATASPMIWMSAKRVRATFSRFQTDDVLYDVEQLATWEMDIQQVFADNIVRDILAREDGGFFNSVREFLGPVDTLNPVTGSYPHVTIHGGYTRESLQEALAVMPQSYYRLVPATAVVNVVTARRLLSLDSLELGFNMAERTFRDGFSEWKMDDINWIATNKLHVVQNDELFLFSDPRAIGKFFIFTDATLDIRVQNGPEFRMQAWETVAAVIANAAGLVLVKFA